MALHRLAIFDALPSYFGGKRRLLGPIFKHLPPPESAPVLADAFLGGGSVALFAKARARLPLCSSSPCCRKIVGAIDCFRIPLWFSNIQSTKSL